MRRAASERFASDTQAPPQEDGVFHLHVGVLPCGRHVWSKIDAEDAGRVLRFRWGYLNAYPAMYVVRRSDDVAVPRLLHRLVSPPPEGLIVDHINGDTLDNRKTNLRFVTASQNAMNTRVSASHLKSSGFKGVSRSGDKWSASISFDGQKIGLGRFDSEADAARAYDAAAVVLFGEFARTNEIQGLYTKARHVYGDGPIWGREAI